MTIQKIRDFLKLESASGLLLISSMVVAVLCANTPLSSLYMNFLETAIEVKVGSFELAKPLLLWINDGLMAIFFLLIGLEVKREVLEGELSSLPQLAMPGIAALGGIVVPALLYVSLNWSNSIALQGWAIPAATDIAFALGVMALLGKGVPHSLKLFLLALAILDDLAAIVIIALFYTAELSVLSLSLATIAVMLLVVLNRYNVANISIYLAVGAFLWVCVLKSGVHATLAGVVLAFAIPLKAQKGSGFSPLKHLEHVLHPWVAFCILPIFAFANSGISVTGLSINDLLAPVPLGIAAGLFVGKQLGIVGFAWIGVKLGLAHLPKDIGWREFHGMAVLCGIGFTMSLFITTLALGGSSASIADSARLGVLLGSFLSSASGYFLLRSAIKKRKAISAKGVGCPRKFLAET